MPDTPPTPGQHAYEAWVCVDGHPRLRQWRELTPLEQRAWDAAAQAAIAAWWQQHEALLCGDKEDDDA